MAKYTAPAPPRSHGYGKILGFTVLAMLAGITLLALELNEYGWESQAKAEPAAKITPLPPPEAGGAKPPAPAPMGP